MRSATADRPPGVYPFLFDPRSMGGEALMHQSLIFDDHRRPDVFFFGGIQVDRRGNLNLLGIPNGDGGWKLRGPGGARAGDDDDPVPRLLHRHAAPRPADLRRAGGRDHRARRPRRAPAPRAPRRRPAPAAVPARRLRLRRRRRDARRLTARRGRARSRARGDRLGPRGPGRPAAHGRADARTSSRSCASAWTCTGRSPARRRASAWRGRSRPWCRPGSRTPPRRRRGRRRRAGRRPART